MDRVKAPNALRIRAERILRKPAKSVYRLAGNVLEVELSDGSIKYVDVMTKKEVQGVKPEKQAIAKNVVNTETEEIKAAKPRATRKKATKEKSTKKKK